MVAKFTVEIEAAGKDEADARQQLGDKLAVTAVTLHSHAANLRNNNDEKSANLIVRQASTILWIAGCVRGPITTPLRSTE